MKSRAAFYWASANVCTSWSRPVLAVPTHTAQAKANEEKENQRYREENCELKVDEVCEGETENPTGTPQKSAEVNFISRGPFWFCGVADHLQVFLMDSIPFWIKLTSTCGVLWKRNGTQYLCNGRNKLHWRIYSHPSWKRGPFQQANVQSKEEISFCRVRFPAPSWKGMQSSSWRCFWSLFYAMPIPTMKIELNSRDCQKFVLDIFEQFQTWAENAFTSQLPPSEMELCQKKSAKEFSLGKNHNLRESYRRQSALAARKWFIDSSPSKQTAANLSTRKAHKKEIVETLFTKQLEMQAALITALTKTAGNQGKRSKL